MEQWSGDVQQYNNQLRIDGNRVELPKGSTVIDYAFNLDSSLP